MIEAAAKDRALPASRVGRRRSRRRSTRASWPASRYTEHADNVALALAVCEALGVERDVALAACRRARPDPGALTATRSTTSGARSSSTTPSPPTTRSRPSSSGSSPSSRTPDVEKRIAVFNCRADRTDRSLQLGTRLRRLDARRPRGADRQRNLPVRPRRHGAGFDGTPAASSPKALAVHEIFERIVGLVERSALDHGHGQHRRPRASRWCATSRIARARWEPPR